LIPLTMVKVMSQLERVKNIKLMNEEKKNHFNP